MSLRFLMRGLNMNKDLIKELVDNIKESAEELANKSEELDLVEQGELIALTEVINIMQDCFAGYDLKAIGLDFDAEEKYLKVKAK